MRNFEFSDNFKKTLNKIFKKDKTSYEVIIKKINEILSSSDIEHYKNLRYEMKQFKRVHISSFVLVFSYDKVNEFISFEDYDYHDKIYLSQ